MAPSPTPPAMTGTTIISSVWRTPSPSDAPTAVPTSRAATDPAAMGTNNRKPPYQQDAVHAENAAHDHRGDEEIEEVGRLGEIRDDLDDLRGNPMVVVQERGHEGGKDRRAADLFQQRHAM